MIFSQNFLCFVPYSSLGFGNFEQKEQLYKSNCGLTSRNGSVFT